MPLSVYFNWHYFSNFCNSWNSNVDYSRRLSHLTGSQLHRGPNCSNPETSGSFYGQCSLVKNDDYNSSNILISQKFRKSLETMDENIVESKISAKQLLHRFSVQEFFETPKSLIFSSNPYRLLSFQNQTVKLSKNYERTITYVTKDGVFSLVLQF